ncbi:cell division protein FtsA [Candidatus Gracilibacteria bacterium]|nr:cell division protein FtsA [Candidatus Gracilibacteria bacterium]NUJ98386.1 cell division protein FtsA [Candidatus Gracilibacteria bacterium]
MSFDGTITAIDIGTSKIRTVIGRFEEGETKSFHVLGIGIASSNAIRKGNILDMEEFKSNLDKSLEDAEKMAGEQVSGAFLSFNSSSFEVITSKGVVAISGSEIAQDDIDRVLEMCKNGVDMPNKEILKVIPEYFVVDLEEGVKNPLGMSARKLEAVAHIFSMNLNVLSNIKKAVADVGIEVYDIYPNLLSAPEGVLTKRQKELGVVCIDIGASTTGVTVFEEGSLKFSSIIPIGGDNVTNDIALGLRTSIDVAEKLKLEFSELNLSEDILKGGEDEIDLSRLNIGENMMLSRLYLSKIATARYEEILFFVREELRKVGKDGMLPEGAILVGGGAKARGLLEVAKDILRLPCFIGTPVEKDSLADTTISDPVFASAIGTMILAKKYSAPASFFSLNVTGVFSSIIKVFKRLLP